MGAHVCPGGGGAVSDRMKCAFKTKCRTSAAATRGRTCKTSVGGAACTRSARQLVYRRLRPHSACLGARSVAATSSTLQRGTMPLPPKIARGIGTTFLKHILVRAAFKSHRRAYVRRWTWKQIVLVPKNWKNWMARTFAIAAARLHVKKRFVAAPRPRATKGCSAINRIGSPGDGLGRRIVSWQWGPGSGRRATNLSYNPSITAHGAS